MKRKEIMFKGNTDEKKRVGGGQKEGRRGGKGVRLPGSGCRHLMPAGSSLGGERLNYRRGR